MSILSSLTNHLLGTNNFWHKCFRHFSYLIVLSCKTVWYSESERVVLTLSQKTRQIGYVSLFKVKSIHNDEENHFFAIFLVY